MIPGTASRVAGAVVMLALLAGSDVLGGGPAEGRSAWTLDAETGVLWRVMTEAEIEAVASESPAERAGWISQRYGNRSAFSSDDEVTIHVAIEGAVQTIRFELQRVDHTPTCVAGVVPAGYGGTPARSGCWPSEDRFYRADDDWLAVHVDGQFLATRYGQGASQVKDPDSRLGLGDLDYLYVLRTRGQPEEVEAGSVYVFDEPAR